MKTDIDIKDELYRFIKGSRLHSLISGDLIKTVRNNDSNKEDVVISVNSNSIGGIQEAYVFVNIYVQDIYDGEKYVEDIPRLRELSNVAKEIFEVFRTDDARISLAEQRVFGCKTAEHVVSNKLLYKQCYY